MTKDKDKHEDEPEDLEADLHAEQDAQRKAAFEGTDSPDPAEGVRADKAKEAEKAAKEDK